MNASRHKDGLLITALLLANEADVTAWNNDRVSPLQTAAQEGHIEVVKLLVHNKADVNASDNSGDSAL